MHGRVSEGWKYFLGMMKYFPLWPGALAGWQGGLETSGARGSGASSDSGGQEAAPAAAQLCHLQRETQLGGPRQDVDCREGRQPRPGMIHSVLRGEIIDNVDVRSISMRGVP